MLNQPTQNTNRILIADDDPVILDIVQTLVEAEGYQAVTAPDGREAYRILINDSDFRAIILDMQMPHMAGTDLLRQIQALKYLNRIPVLMMSSSIDLKVLASGFGAGAMAFVPKPFTPEQMRNTLRLITFADPRCSSARSSSWGGDSKPTNIADVHLDRKPINKIAANTIHVLLIEDNPGEAMVIESSLFQGATKVPGLASVEVSHASLVSEGIGRLRAGGVDVVLLDLGLPDSEGLETLIMLLEQDSGVPIVVLTGNESETTACEAIQLGAQGYLVKGQVDAMGIIRAVQHACEAR